MSNDISRVDTSPADQVIGISALTAARHALELADSLPDVAKLIDGAELAREYCIRADASEAAQRDWATYSLRAQRKAGEILERMKMSQGGRPSKTNATVAPVSTLREVLSTKTDAEARHKSKRWKSVAAIPAAAFESYVDTTAEVSRSRLLRIGRDIKAETKRRERAAEVVEDIDADAPRMDLRLGDFRTVLADIPDGSVDAIITDPPYPKEYVPLLADLGSLTFAQANY